MLQQPEASRASSPGPGSLGSLTRRREPGGRLARWTQTAWVSKTEQTAPSLSALLTDAQPRAHAEMHIGGTGSQRHRLSGPQFLGGTRPRSHHPNREL